MCEPFGSWGNVFWSLWPHSLVSWAPQECYRYEGTFHCYPSCVPVLYAYCQCLPLSFIFVLSFSSNSYLHFLILNPSALKPSSASLSSVSKHLSVCVNDSLLHSLRAFSALVFVTSWWHSCLNNSWMCGPGRICREKWKREKSMLTILVPKASGSYNFL